MMMKVFEFKRPRLAWLLGLALLVAGGAAGCGDDTVEPPCTDDNQCLSSEFCDLNTGACTEGCRLDPDNCEEGETCDPDDHVCKSETVTPDCEEDDPLSCGQDKHCEDGICVAGCTADSCEDGTHCNDDTGKCEDDVVEPECEDDDACEADQYCDLETGLCMDGCQTSPDNCDVGFCDPLTHECICDPSDDSTCPDGFHCDPGLLECIADCDPEDPQACSPGYVCDPISGICEELPPGCTGDTDCAPNEYCNEDGICAEGCREGDADTCPDGRICVNGTCEIEPCADDQACAPNQFCDLTLDPPACVEGCHLDPDNCPECEMCDPTLRQCVDDGSCGCQTDVDCPPRQYCDDGTCEIGCRPGDAESCPEGWVCDPITHECIPTICTSDDQCPPDQYCSQDGCVPGCRLNPDNCTEEDYICHPDTHVCTLVGFHCASDADCHNSPDFGYGYWCLIQSDETEGSCVPGCSLDDPNDPTCLNLNPDCTLEMVCSVEDLTGYHVCQFSGAYVICDGNEDCANGYHCEMVEGCPNIDICVEGCNGDDSRCDEGQHCEGEICVDDCTEDSCEECFICDPNSGRCVEGCNDDEYEGNNDIATATPVVLTDTAGSISDLVICNSDEDYFAVEVAEDESRLDAKIIFLNANGNLDLDLLNPDGSTRLRAQTDTDDETISIPVEENLPAGTYYLRVYPIQIPQAFCRQTYELQVHVVPKDECPRGLGEIEPNESQEEAVPRIHDGENPLLSSQYTICDDRPDMDEDWFSFEVPYAGIEPELRLVYNINSGADLDLVLQNEAGIVVSYSTEESLGVRVIDMQGAALPTGTYYIRVFAPLHGMNFYDLQTRLWGFGAFCQDDIYDENEGNDTRETATELLTLGPNDVPARETIEGLVHCTNNDDWYNITIPENAKLHVEVYLNEGEDEDGDIDLRLYGPDGLLVSESTASGPGMELVENSIYTAGTYQLRVYGHSPTADAPTTYRMEIDVEYGYCEEEWSNSNRNCQGALEVGDGWEVEDAQYCEDEDWFFFELTCGHTVEVDLTYTLGDLELTLVSSNCSTTLAYDTGSLGDQSLTHTISVPGTYYLRVRGFEPTLYTMAVTLTPGPDCVACLPDAYEPNDDMMDPSPIEDFDDPELLRLNLCSEGDSGDFFSIYVAENEEWTISIVHEAARDLDLIVIAPDGTYCDSTYGSGSTSEEVCISTDIDTVPDDNVCGSMSGEYTIWVYEAVPFDPIEWYSLRIESGAMCSGF